jgi:hypothetical protein
MMTWTGMWDCDPPMRAYSCMVCDTFWNTTSWHNDDELPFGDLPFVDMEKYIRAEAKLALYVIEAGVVPTAAKHGPI